MKRHFHVYKRLLRINLNSFVMYRGNFINNIVASTTWGIFSVVVVLLLTAKIDSVLGWTRNEIVFLTATYALVMGIFHMVFSRNFQRLAEMTHFGELDSILVKPIDSQFSVSFWVFSYAHVVRVIIGLLLALYLAIQMQWTVTLVDVVVYFLLILLGVALLYSVWMMVMTLTVWHTRLSNLVEMMYTVSSIGRFPKEIYREISSYVLFILLPVTLTINTPARSILKKPLGWEIFILLGLAVTFFILARKFWFFALRFYTSASS